MAASTPYGMVHSSYGAVQPYHAAGPYDYYTGGYGRNESAFERQQALAELQNQQKQQWRDRIFGLFNSQLQAFQGQPVGGQSGASPEITVGPIWDQGQIQQQVNAQQARNARSTATQGRQTMSRLAGQGFAPTSPLAQALLGQQQARLMGANADAQRDIRFGAAEKNAGQVLKSQQAREAQFAQRMQEDIERRRLQFGGFQSLIGALAGLG